jgi:hypothetical protein
MLEEFSVGCLSLAIEADVEKIMPPALLGSDTELSQLVSVLKSEAWRQLVDDEVVPPCTRIQAAPRNIRLVRLVQWLSLSWMLTMLTMDKTSLRYMPSKNTSKSKLPLV